MKFRVENQAGEHLVTVDEWRDDEDEAPWAVGDEVWFNNELVGKILEIREPAAGQSEGTIVVKT